MWVENATSISRPGPDGTEYVRATADNVSFIFGQLLSDAKQVAYKHFPHPHKVHLHVLSHKKK
jgi:hypothetical protein